MCVYLSVCVPVTLLAPTYLVCKSKLGVIYQAYDVCLSSDSLVEVSLGSENNVIVNIYIVWISSLKEYSLRLWVTVHPHMGISIPRQTTSENVASSFSSLVWFSFDRKEVFILFLRHLGSA